MVYCITWKYIILFCIIIHYVIFYDTILQTCHVMICFVVCVYIYIYQYIQGHLSSFISLTRLNRSHHFQVWCVHFWIVHLGKRNSKPLKKKKKTKKKLDRSEQSEIWRFPKMGHPQATMVILILSHAHPWHLYDLVYTMTKRTAPCRCVDANDTREWHIQRSTPQWGNGSIL